MTKTQKVIVLLFVFSILASFYFIFGNKEVRKPIELNNNNQSLPQVSVTPANSGDVSSLSGLPCENWKRRSFAVMQPADVSARPLAGLSQADMVIEMSAVYGSITRLMGVYGCSSPEEVGSLRSARHDFVHLAKSFDAIYVHWGRADIEQFKHILDSGFIDDMNCNNDAGKSAGQYCFRKTAVGNMRGVDTGYAKFATLLEGAKNFGYRMENTFVGYPHQEEVSLEERPLGGNLRVAYAKPFDVEYDYDKETNSFVRTWGGAVDTDRNTKAKIAPKNVVVMIADAAPIKVGEQYVNVQIGDPWFDQVDSGAMFYYMNGKQYRGTWKKDKSSAESKLLFLDESGQEVKFVPGQIWVDIIDPGQSLKWQPGQ